MFQKYRPLAGFTSLVISATLFTDSRITGLAAGSTVAAAPVTLTPVISAGIPGSSGMRLSDVGVYKNASLWFLMHHAGVAQLLRIDPSGDVKQIVDLGGDRPAPVTGVSTSSDGQFAITRHNNEVELYSTDGSISKLGTVGKQSLGRAFVDGRLFEVTGNEIFAADNPTNTRKSIPPPLLHWPVTAFGLGTDRLGVIEMEGGILHTLDMRTGIWRIHQLAAPEIQSSDRPPSTADGTVSPAIFSVAVDRSTHNIYTANNPYSVIEGASILVFTERGVLLHRLRCSLPRSSAFRNSRNTDGHFSLSKIVFVQGRLFLVSFSQSYFLGYNVP